MIGTKFSYENSLHMVVFFAATEWSKGAAPFYTSGLYVTLCNAAGAVRHHNSASVQRWLG